MQEPPANLRYLLLMRHAKHDKGGPKPPDQTPLDKIATSMRELAEGSSASWWPPWATREVSTPPREGLTAQGSYETRAAAHYLSQFLIERRGPSEGKQASKTAGGVDSGPAASAENYDTLTLAGVLHSNTPEAIATAEAFLETFRPELPCAAGDCVPSAEPAAEIEIAGPERKSETKSDCYDETKEPGLLGPGTDPRDLDKPDGKSLQDQVRNAAADLLKSRKGNAVLFIGHQPAIGWVAGALLGEAVPIVQSEILCVDLRAKPRPVLRWCISPSDATALADLKEKIKSKMALANVLSGFLTAGIGVFLSLLADKNKIGVLGVQTVVVFVAAAFLIFAVFLYLRTMFSYDALLMPVRFWAETAAGSENPSWIVARPPSGAPWILYQNMLRIWRKQFIPATILTASGLLYLWSAVLLATLEISHSEDWHDTVRARVFGLVPTTVLLLLFFSLRGNKVGRWWSRKSRYRSGPWLGSED